MKELVEEIAYTEKSTLELLLGNVLHFQDFPKHQVFIHDSGILYFKMKDKKVLSVADLDATRRWVRGFGPKKYLNLIEAGHTTEVEEDIRLSSASSEQNNYTIADAIIVKNISQRIIANFYLRFNKPAKPTKIFTDAESAAFWLMSFR